MLHVYTCTCTYIIIHVHCTCTYSIITGNLLKRGKSTEIRDGKKKHRNKRTYSGREESYHGMHQLPCKHELDNCYYMYILECAMCFCLA